MTYIFLPIYKL